MAGQPTKLIPEIMDKIIQGISVCAPISTACDAAGLSDETLRLWRHEYEEALTRTGDLSERDLCLIEFFGRIKKAFAEAEIAELREIQRNPKGFFNRAWLLERTRQDKYALRGKLEIEAKDPVKITIETVDKRERKEK